MSHKKINLLDMIKNRCHILQPCDDANPCQRGECGDDGYCGKGSGEEGGDSGRHRVSVR